MTHIDEYKIFAGGMVSLNKAIRTIAFATIDEINYVLDKLNYYIEHLNIISSSNNVFTSPTEIKTKKEYLLNLQNILIEEIDRRQTKSVK